MFFWLVFFRKLHAHKSIMYVACGRMRTNRNKCVFYTFTQYSKNWIDKGLPQTHSLTSFIAQITLLTKFIVLWSVRNSVLNESAKEHMILQPKKYGFNIEMNTLRESFAVFISNCWYTSNQKRIHIQMKKSKMCFWVDGVFLTP